MGILTGGMEMSEQVQPPAYQPGQVVNGHVWTGTEWLPVAQPSLPVPVKPPLSARFDAMPWGRKILLMGLVGAGGLMAAFLVAGVSDALGL